jgi:hypothetical protein
MVDIILDGTARVLKLGENSDLAQIAATASGASATRSRNAVPFSTWAALAAATGMVAGDRASVLVADTGTHTDPVVGGTVSNAGIYTYSASPVGWQRTADLDSAAALTYSNNAAASAALALSYQNNAAASAATALINSASLIPYILTQPTGFTAINAEGWSNTWASPTDLSLSPINFLRQGFSTSAATTTYIIQRKFTKRKRQAYPNQGSFSTSDVAMDDYVYTTDSPLTLGVFNNSTVSCPKPIAAWVMPDRLLVASSVHWEIAAFHRDACNLGAGGVGQQVACVQVRANNGTTQTAWQTVSATSISSFVEDANPVGVFQGDLDVSSLADGLFWLEAKVYPWFGAAASILSSEDQSNAREFSRRYFRKGATVNYVYVASTGNDTTGVCSTTAATAAASPCLTVAGAILKARTTLGTGTVGALDGLRVRIVDTVNTGATSMLAFNPLRQDVAGVVIERAPGTARASAIVTLSSTFRPSFTNHTAPNTEGSLIFYDVSVAVGGAFLIQGETANKLHIQFWNCNLNYGSFATNLRASSHISMFGVVASNLGSTALGISTGNEIRMQRGVIADLANASPEGWVTVGSTLTRASGPSFTDASVNGHIWYNNKFLNPASTNAPLYFKGSVSGGDLGAIAMVQNLVERIDTGNNPNMRVGSDSDFGNITHAVIQHNTTTGTNDAGRTNISYDEHPTVPRFHKLISYKGNLMPSLNVKGDDYSLIQDGTRLGHFPIEHGVGCAGNFTKDVNALSGGASFGQAYPGIGSVIAGGDPLFTNNQSVTKPAASLVAGAGGGDYTLQAGSPARSLLTTPVLRFDLAGNLRGTGAQNAGAYA